ncbi:MAG: HD domain-containing protein [Bacteroidota bacterium]|nr:HD domain-containing protein [Bacteroidota bacterium]
MANKRYILDSLYGIIHLPSYVWEVLTTPELQRLREIRLCNINSLSLTGGANINRYEHAIGTCYLAIKCYESWLLKKSLSENEIKAFLIAALFHDVANSAFGHTIEYVEDYKPENSFIEVLKKVKGNNFTSHRSTFEMVFFGLSGTLGETLYTKLKLSTSDIDLISDGIQGKGLFGPLISNDIDLDNIDNVYRMAFHLGLVNDKTIPVKLATSLIIEDNKLLIKDEGIPFLEDWHFTRKLLYKFLLLNPDEFSGKCMLTEAVENSKNEADSLFPFRWFDTDYDLLKHLSVTSSENNVIIQRLMTGNLYGCIGIFSTKKIEHYTRFLNTELRKGIEVEVETIIRKKYPNLKSALIAIHPILDKNKTERKIHIQTTSNIETTIGTSSRHLLLGFFFKNKDLNVTKIGNTNIPITSIQADIKSFLINTLNDAEISQLSLYDESN